MDQKTLQKTYRNALILLVVASMFVVLFFFFALRTNQNPPAPAWEMGGVPFVPASSPYAEGYYDSSKTPEEETK